MRIRRVQCPGKRFMEYLLAKLQEIYSHVEFVSYDGDYLTVAYIA